MNFNYFKKLNLISIIVTIIVLALTNYLKVGTGGFDYVFNFIVLVILLIPSFFSSFVMLYTAPFFIAYALGTTSIPKENASILNYIILLLLYLLIFNYINPKNEFSPIKSIYLYFLFLGNLVIQDFFFYYTYASPFALLEMSYKIGSSGILILEIFITYVIYKKYIEKKLQDKIFQPTATLALCTFIVAGIGYFLSFFIFVLIKSIITL